MQKFDIRTVPAVELTKLTNLINSMTIYTLKIFNTGQITLPKKWRDKLKTKVLIAEETPEGLLIKPVESTKSTFIDSIEDSWQEYLDGKTISLEELQKKYDL